MAALEEPDRGYAWVILLCSLIINAILSGMARMVGLLYVALIDAYEVTREEASLPFTVRNAVRYMAGPLTGALGQTYGIRAVSFWGGVIAATGSILCTFAPSVSWIVLFWGLVHGIGFGMAVTLFQVIINQYFEKYRATASGIVMAGACASAFLFPFMIDTVLSEYGVFGCFLLLGGLFLNILPPSLMLKSPSWVEFPEAYAKKRALLLNHPNGENCQKDTPICVSRPQIPTKTSSTKLIEVDLSKKLKRYCIGSADQNNAICTIYRLFDSDETMKREKKTNLQDGIDNPTFVPDHVESCIQFVEKKSIKTPPAPEEKNNFLKNMRKIPQLYLNPMYILISVSVAVYFSAFLPVLVVIVDYGRDKGIPESRKEFLIYSFTIGDMFGRLAFGWVTDRNCISFPNFMILTYISQGIFVVLFIMSNSLITNMVTLALYGISAGIQIVQFPVLVHKYVKEENQTIAIGCVGLFSSMATFGIPPLIGYFRDNVGSYDGLFYIIAALSEITGGLWLLASIYQMMKYNKQQQLTSK